MTSLIKKIEDHPIKIEVTIKQIVQFIAFVSVSYGFFELYSYIIETYPNEVAEYKRYYLPKSYGEIYYGFFDYLITDECDRVGERIKSLKLQRLEAIKETRELSIEIEQLKELIKKKEKLILPDTTDIEVKIQERRDADEYEFKWRRVRFWSMIAITATYEIWFLYNFW